MGLYKIGEVSTLCNISIKTLRYYEELGLLKPVKVDIYSGYRYYDENNIEIIYKIQLFKELGFSLQEIKNFDEKSFDEKIIKINAQIDKLKTNLNLISSLKNVSGEYIMKPFINDEQVIGKWSYECSAISKNAYDKGDLYIDNDVLLKELYFLPNGEGYWIFDRWTKGTLYCYSIVAYRYDVYDDKLFVEVRNENNEYEITLVFNKVNSNEYAKEEIKIKDNTNLGFELDEAAIGSWEAIDYVPVENKEIYVPCKKDNLFLKGLTIVANGNCFKEYSTGKIDKINWTKDYILDKEMSLSSNYLIKDIDNERYLIMDWKSGDYVYGGRIYCCYVFKLVK
jgi:DNA-binding transcriptional MerR regulator